MPYEVAVAHFVGHLPVGSALTMTEKPCTNGVDWVLVRTPLSPTRKWHAAGKRAVISTGSRPRSTPWQDRRCVAHRPPTECRSSAFLAWRTSRVRSAMNSHRHLPRRQGGRYHPSGKRAGDEQLHTDLDMRHVVPVQHNIAAAAVDPACVQACPHLIHQLPPQGWELLPGGRRRHHCCRASQDVCHGYLIAHVPSCIASGSFSHKTLQQSRCRV